MNEVLVQIDRIGKMFAERAILQAVTLQINASHRIGIVGSNGSGKSTLLDIIAGRRHSDSGAIHWVKKDCTIHYLTQSRNETQCRNEDSGDVSSYARQLGLVTVIAQANGGNQAHLSGGERTRLAIAAAWSSRADLLILDEPTNHLDADGIDWLIDHVRQYPGAVLIVSHDRYFLDKTAEQIIELQGGRAKLYQGNYSDYVNQRDRERLSQRREHEKQKREQERLEHQIEEIQHWAKQGHRKAGKQGTLSERKQLGYKQYRRAKVKKLDSRVKSQIKRLEKLRSAPIMMPVQNEAVQFRLTEASRHGASLIQARGLGKSFRKHVLFEQSSFFIRRGERIGLVGPNGCGKTTFLRMILGDEPTYEGQLWVSPTAKVAHLSQQDADMPADMAFRSFEKDLSVQERARFRAILANVGLDATKLQTPLSSLSLGERTRFKLAQIMLEDYNLVILDEPTNHLDITSREALERSLETYRGTLLIATHDRYLLERVCDYRLVFHQHRIVKTYKDGHVDDPGDTGGTRPGRVHEGREELMVVEAKIARLLGDLSTVKPNEPQYKVWDAELNVLLEQRRLLRARNRT